MFKKLMALALCVIMAMQFASCGKTENTSNFQGGATGDYVISEEPVELRIFYNSSKEEDGQWNNLKEAAKMTNVMGTVTIPKSNSDFNQAFNIMLASGDIPDIVTTYDIPNFLNYGIEGAFVPLNEYLDEMPNFKKILEDEEIRKGITATDGNIYLVPFMPGGYTSSGWFIRTDWLKKLNLEVPKTTNELYKVLTAFATKDPNGNGKADEIPFYGTKTLTDLFPLWDARGEWYTENGKIYFGPYEDNYRTAVENIIKWYNEGLIDKEVFTRGSSDMEKMLADNRLGSAASGWFGSSSKFNDKYGTVIEGFEYKPIAPINGIALSRRPKVGGWGWGISTSSDKIDIAVKYLDFWLGEAGDMLMNFGVEGVHYDMVDGEPVFKAEKLANPDFKKELTDFGIQMDIGFKQNFEYEKQWLNEIAIEGMEMYMNGGWYVEQLPPVDNYVDKEDSSRNSELTVQVETYTSEQFQKCVLGAEKLDDASWDKYIKQLEKFGVKELMTIKQKGLDNYNE